MVEAGGVETSQLFVVVRDHVNSFENLRTSFSDIRTVTHHDEELLSRPVPSDRQRAGGASEWVGQLNVMDPSSAKFFTKGH